MPKGKRTIEPQEMRAKINALRQEQGQFVSVDARIKYSKIIERLEREMANDKAREIYRAGRFGRAVITSGLIFGIVVTLLIMGWALTSSPHDDYQPVRDEASNPFE